MMQNVRLGPQLFQVLCLGCCAAVSRQRICVVVCALVHRVSLWLLCERAMLLAIGVD